MIAPKSMVAPYQSCVRCYRGDTSTAFGLIGAAEWIIAVFHAKLGIPFDEALGTFQVFCEQELGCEPGLVPDGRITHAVRLCQECADECGIKVATPPALPAAVQPEGAGDE